MKPESDPRSDETLVNALNQGEADAFETLYYRYREWVVGMAYRFTGNREDAVDVLQETFAYFLRKFPGFKLRAKLTTFLYPVVKNISLRARQKRMRFASNEEIPEEPVEAEDTDDWEQRSELSTVMQGLSDGHREVVMLRFVDGMTVEEIAQALEVPLGTVKSRLHHALEALRGDARVRKYFEK